MDGADGNVSPVLCRDGHPNSYALPALQAAGPNLLALGALATPTQVLTAACADLSNGSTNPVEESTYQFAAAFNGWSFGVDPTDGGLFTGC